MNRKVLLFLSVCVFTACMARKPAGSVEHAAVASSASAAATVGLPKQTQEPDNRSPIPTATLIPSTPTFPREAPTRLTPRTVDLDENKLVSPTRRPSPVPIRLEACAQGNPGLKPDFKAAFEDQNNMYLDLYKPVLDFLNAGGTVQAVIDEIRIYDPKNYDQYILVKDLTGDGIPEVSLNDSSVTVFGCMNDEYIGIGIADAYSGFGASRIYSVVDMNLDGIPEVVIYNRDSCGFAGRCSEAYITEWSGKNFVNLVDPDLFGIGGGSFDVEVKDVDGNGTLELLTTGGIPNGSPYYDGFPWRVQTNTYQWNGKVFVLADTEYTPPVYRYQAVQDGDRAFLKKEYDRALDLYQQAIFSDKLDWWSAPHERYEYNQMTAWMIDPTPTPEPSPTPDPLEYFNLAAYARFRILLLHVVRGWLPEAQTVYDTLQAKFPEGQPGHAFAEMATAFWDEYQASQKVGQACASAVAYATKHSGVLTYLGSDFHGHQDHKYVPQDVCPVP